MTEKEKAEAYDEAIERAKKLYGNGIIEEIFPELKESKDKKIIKWIIDDIRYNMDNEPLNNSKYKKEAEKAIAWLEKQGKNSTDKTKPRFRVGDWITFYGGNSFKILKIETEINGVLDYLLLDQNGYDSYFNKTYVDENARLWTIQDAKDGDVLACNEEILLFKSYSVLQERISLYCWYNGQTNNFHGKEVIDILLTTTNKVCPATKEQCNALMKAMNDAGYEWDAEKKELKKNVRIQ